MDRPEYIAENPDGSVTITLTDGSTMTMREPLVEDQLATKGTNEDRELALVGNLTGKTPAEVRGLRIRDYRRVQAALGFLSN